MPSKESIAKVESIKALERELRRIVATSRSRAERIESMTKAFYAAVEEWNRLGDDGVIGRMRIVAAVEVEDLVEAEIEVIRGSDDPERHFVQLRRDIEAIPWISETFKGSMYTEIAFARAGARLSMR